MHHFDAHELADSWELRAGLLDEDPADASISACLRECAAALRDIATPSPAEGDRAKLVADLMLMVGRYWDLAYAEGKEGRNHDTKDGAAQRTLTAILSAVKHLAGLTPLDVQPKGTEPVGWTSEPIEWSPRQSEQVLKITRKAQPQYGFVYPLHASAQAPAPVADRPLPAELGEWLTAIGDLYIAMGRPPFEATEPTMGVVETLREAAKRVATIEGLQQAVAAGFPVVARWTKNAKDGAPRARVWVQFEDGGPEVEFASELQAPAVAHQPETAMPADNTFNTAFLKLQEISAEAGAVKGYWPGDSDRIERVVKLANEVIEVLMQAPSGDFTHEEYIALTNPGALKPLEVGFGSQESQPPVQHKEQS